MMKMCASHWGDLKKAINDRGLSKFVSASGQEVIQKMQADGFDPLMNANMDINAAALHDGGLQVMVGDKCPLCEAEKNIEGLALNWINGSCDDQLNEARKRGLISNN